MLCRGRVKGICGLLCVYSCNITAITYVFSHGFSDSYKQAYKYVNYYRKKRKIRKNKRYILYQPLKAFNYPDVIYGKLFNVFRTSLGQMNEVNTLLANYNQVKDDTVVLFGISRGASTAINFAAKHNPENLKALIVESPFDKVKVVLKNHWLASFLAKIPGVNDESVYRFFRKISKYDENGLQPIDLIAHIDKHIPVLLICSNKDKVIPHGSTVNLYEALVASGHTKAHLLVLSTGKHAKLINSKQGEIYQNVVHAFYKKYNLMYEPAFAKKGAYAFSKTQPAVQCAESVSKGFLVIDY